jgi:D-arabinonate dehydratase
MEITDITARVIRDKIQHPYTNSVVDSLVESVETTIIEVQTDAGITGVVGSGMMSEECRNIVLNQLKPEIVGENPLDHERVWWKMYGGEGGWRPPFSKGEVVRAISTVETALWDIRGKTWDTPVYKLLGGFRDEVPCYASGGHYVTLGTHKKELEFLEWEMSQYMDMGFEAVKMRVGRDVSKDQERVELVRDIIGEGTKLMIDFNSSPSHHHGESHAIKFMNRLEKYDPFWFEDPLQVEDRAGLERITEAIDTAIATGEFEQTIWEFKELIVDKKVDILLPDATAFCGGISQWKKIAAMAEAFHMPVAAHIGGITHLHCVASVPNGLTVEVFRPFDTNRRGYESEPPITPNARGKLPVPQKPGLGLELDESYIENHLVNQ